LSASPDEIVRPRRRRSRWQFGLRSLLGLMALVGVVCAAISYYLAYQATLRHEQSAIEAVTELGGKCEMSSREVTVLGWPISVNRVTAVDLGYYVTITGWENSPPGAPPMRASYSLRQQVTDAWLAQLAPLEHLEVLDLTGNKINGEGLAVLSHLTRLKTLVLMDSRVDDAAMAHVALLKELKSLRLEDTSVGDDGLRHIAALTNLTVLRVGDRSSRITGDGLAHLRSLTLLEVLDLAITELSVGEIDILEALPKLRVLDIRYCQIAPTAVERMSRLKNLEELHFSISSQREEIAAVDDLRRARPDLKVFVGRRF
jgi:hypothetical protein